MLWTEPGRVYVGWGFTESKNPRSDSLSKKKITNIQFFIFRLQQKKISLKLI